MQSRVRLLVSLALLSSAATGPLCAQFLPVPAPAAARVAAVQVRVAPDHADWTYAPGEPARFLVTLTADNQPLAGEEVRYTVGPEMLPADRKTAVIPADGPLVIDGGTMTEPGFLRCSVVYERDGRRVRSLATAGFAPARIRPTQVEPVDFDEFWAAAKADLAKVPPDLRLVPMPELSTSNVSVHQVSFQNVAPKGNLQAGSRIYGILCEPKGPGPFPAVLCLPGAGVRPYTGNRELAERGVITLEIGIHGIPVNLPKELYDQLGTGALAGYETLNLDIRDRYYYRRVYLGCLRANDVLVSRPQFDGRNLAVMGGSQGGQLSIVTAALDPRVTALAATYPAYCDVTGYLHGRAGGWPHMLKLEKSGHRTPGKIATTAYYDTVNFARRLKAPGYFTWGYNDEVCPPTSMFAAYNVITSPKTLVLALESGHVTGPEQSATTLRWLLDIAGRPNPAPAAAVTDK